MNNQEKGQILWKKVQQKLKSNLVLVTATNKLYVMTWLKSKKLLIFFETWKYLVA